jgi:hypothetical protein
MKEREIVASDPPQKLYSDPNSMEGEIKEDRNPGERMG